MSSVSWLVGSMAVARGRVPPHLGGRVEDICSRLAPGRCVFAWYVDDKVWHEVYPVWPVDESVWIILTPDDDLYAAHMDGSDTDDGVLGISELNLDSSIPGVVHKQTHRFKQYPSSRTFGQLLLDGRKLVGQTRGACGIEVVPDVVIDPEGVQREVEDFLARVPSAPLRRRLRKKGPVAGSQVVAYDDSQRVDTAIVLAPGVAAAAEAPDGFLWVTAEAIGGRRIGQEMTVDMGTDVCLGSRVLMCRRGDEWIKCNSVAVADAPSFREERLREIKGQGGDEVSGDVLRGRLGREVLPSEDATPRVVKDAAVEDFRTLWVDYDDQCDRWKEWERVCQESTVQAPADLPLHGPGSMLFLIKKMERQGGDPRRWLQEWIREKRMESTDRAVHELRELCDIIFYAGTYYCLNMGGLACSEVAGRRINAIFDAYSNPNKVNWGMANFYTGRETADDTVDPAFRSWADRQAKEETDIVVGRAKALELRGGQAPVGLLAALGTVSDSAASGALSGGGKPGGKGGGKQDTPKGGRGQGLAAAVPT